MISIHDLITLAFLAVAGYFAFWFHELVILIRNANFSDYSSYKKAISETERKIWKPSRKRDDEGIHRVMGDRTKITLRDPNGVAHTQDALIDIADANPDDVMKAIDDYGVEG